jgi:mannose-1-phosphate guanylyltransferase
MSTTPYAVILAGGSGTRFWPKSRQKRPKQLCTIGPGSLTMIEQTVKRLDGFIPPSHRVVVTHEDQLDATRAILKDTVAHYLAEPVAKNTAPALIYASLYLQKLDPAATMVSLHADHLIQDPKDFTTQLSLALKQTQNAKIALVGVHPSYPETGFGYIQKDASIATDVYTVKSFKEKPDLATAKEYLASGQYLWNAGYFCWRVEDFLTEAKEFLPDLTRALTDGFVQDRIHDVYPSIQGIAVDNGILEKSQKLCVVPLKSGWSDVGSWDALSRDFGSEDGSYISADSFLKDCSGVTIDADKKTKHFIAAIGLKDVIIVHTEDASLVCHKDRAQDVKDVVAWLKSKDRNNLT